jgi:hypothetical protein
LCICKWTIATLQTDDVTNNRACYSTNMDPDLHVYASKTMRGERIEQHTMVKLKKCDTWNWSLILVYQTKCGNQGNIGVPV